MKITTKCLKFAAKNKMYLPSWWLKSDKQQKCANISLWEGVSKLERHSHGISYISKEIIKKKTKLKRMGLFLMERKENKFLVVLAEILVQGVILKISGLKSFSENRCFSENSVFES